VELECQNRGVIFQWLRGFYIVGNSIDGCSIFSKIVQAADQGKKEFPFTLGLNQFDFLDYSIFCQYVADAVEQEQINGIINICKGRPEKLADRVERFIKENKFDIELKYGAFPDRPYDSKAIWGDDRKIQEIEENMNKG
jgi:dTDP-6-deoxy-L-talose 4-dehydrogenase (NAD+)